MTPVPILALDVPTSAEALALVTRFGVQCRFYKVGLELFTASGPHIVHAIREQGADVFLDLKLHDIPNTVRGAARSAARLGVRLLTVHATGGGAMVRSAVEGAGPGCGILAVTLLTSLDAATVGEVWGRPDTVDVTAEVGRLAALAASSGAHGVVCSGHEAAGVREVHGESLATLVPGIRLAGEARQDQSRVVTPAQAAAAGARYVVLGRAVTAAVDPIEALARHVRELAIAAGQGPDGGPETGR